MLKKMLFALALLPLAAGYAFAQSGESVHLFDDLNGDGISDGSVNPPSAEGDVPTEESVDAEQPVDEPTPEPTIAP
jgi:hypothetical protein